MNFVLFGLRGMFEMQSNGIRRNVNNQFCSDYLVDRVAGARENGSKMFSDSITISPSSSPTHSPNGGVNFIEHRVSKMDTLAGVAIKYGVEVTDIKRINGLVTDLQMFALKSLQIPLPGRHPPSPALSNGSVNSGQSNSGKTPPRQPHLDLFESLQSLGLKSPQQKVSPAMSSLQGYYRLKPQKPTNHEDPSEGTEMAIYRTDTEHYFENGLIPKFSSSSDPSLNRHRKSRSFINGFFRENGEPIEEVSLTEVGDDEAEKTNEKSVRRRQKAEIESNSQTPELLLREDSSGGSGFSFSKIAGKGLALRPKSASRTSLAPEVESGYLNPVPVGLGDSLMVDGFNAVRKSSSTSNLQDQENGTSLSIWQNSKWNLKQDLQALSNSGLPKPITRKNKAALD